MDSNNYQLEHLMYKKIPFTITMKKIKYLGINPTSMRQNSYGNTAKYFLNKQK